MRAADLDALIVSGERIVHVRVAEAKGSTPRESGAWMLVTASTMLGTIGGGALEFRAIDLARKMLEGGNADEQTLELPLGPEIGQCCGGRVGLSLNRMDKKMLEELHAGLKAQEEKQPQILVFGGGHVGLALARALSPLPFRTRLIETRPDILPPELTISHEIVAVPEMLVRTLDAGAAVVVLTHDHALDFLIVSEALKRNDLAYVGMIGSQTKRATFRNQWLRDGGEARLLERLVCPIGNAAVRDKRPEIIATLAAAEITERLLGPP